MLSSCELPFWERAGRWRDTALVMRHFCSFQSERHYCSVSRPLLEPTVLMLTETTDRQYQQFLKGVKPLSSLAHLCDREARLLSWKRRQKAQ